MKGPNLSSRIFKKRELVTSGGREQNWKIIHFSVNLKKGTFSVVLHLSFTCLSLLPSVVAKSSN